MSVFSFIKYNAQTQRHKFSHAPQENKLSPNFTESAQVPDQNQINPKSIVARSNR